MTQELLADLRSRINPAYQDVRGTESHERKQCADAIEALQAEVNAANSACESAIKRAEAMEAERNTLDAKLDTAIQSSAHWQHQCTELQAENERMKAQTQTLLYDCNTWAQELKNERRLSFRAERDKLQARLDAMGKGEAVQFLCDATRFKVRQHEGDEAGRIFGLPSELNGRWVALVAADDDCHLKLAAPEALAPLTEDAERTAFEAWVKESAGDLRTFGSGSNKHYLNSAVNNAWGGWKQRAHGIHAKGGQQ